MVRLILIRHGETDWNARRRYQGQTDVPLNETGVRQVESLAKNLEHQIDAIYASDLVRAMRTARIIASRYGLNVHTEPRLREMCFGEWEGLTHDEIQVRWRDERKAWFADPAHVAPPGGETLDEVAARVGDFLDTLRQIEDDRTIVLASHGGVLRVLLCLAMGLDVNKCWWFALGAASVSELRISGRDAVLSRWNDTHYRMPDFAENEG